MRGLTRYLVLLQALWWFGYFAPGHQRGVVTLGEVRGGASCCAVDAAGNGFVGCALPGEGGERGSGRSDPSKRCAVCYLVAHMDAPVVVDWSLPPLGLAALLEEMGSERVCVAEVGGWYLGRAPPVV